MTQKTVVNDFAFVVEVTERKTNRITIRVKDGVLYVSCPYHTSQRTIMKIISDHADTLQAEVSVKPEQVVHVNGLAYECEMRLGSRNCVYFQDQKIILVSKKDGIEHYRKVLHDYYYRILEAEVARLIPEAKADFPEVDFPVIKCRYLKSMFGNYSRRTREIHLSTMLAKYEVSYIKSVLYHELTHMLHFDHSPEFYATYEQKYPQARVIQKRLRKINYNDFI